MCSCYFAMSNDSTEIVSVTSFYSEPEQGEKARYSQYHFLERQSGTWPCC